jgi:hypothetical protein
VTSPPKTPRNYLVTISAKLAELGISFVPSRQDNSAD